VLSAARRGDTKFHDPSRAIYLNRASQRSGMLKGGGFLLDNIGNTAGNRLANGYVQDHTARGSWRYSVPSGRQPEFDANETEKLRPAADEQVWLHVVSWYTIRHMLTVSIVNLVLWYSCFCIMKGIQF